MKKLLKPASLTFCFLMAVVFFVTGIYLAGLFGAGENQGLAAGAIVIGWGVLSAGVAFILSLFTVYRVLHKTIVRLNFLLLFVVVILYGITHYRFIQKQKEKDKERNKTELPDVKPATPISGIAPASLISHSSFSGQNTPVTEVGLGGFSTADTALGIGFFMPDIFEASSLWFYGVINWDKPVNDHAPQDSITFRRTQYGGFEISYAPPYFYPEHLKLDYDILYLKTLSAGRDFIEVEVNRITGQTAYVDRYKGTLKYWPEFLLGVHSVELKEAGSQAVKIKPLDHASEVISAFYFMRPQLIKDEWMKVDLLDQSFIKVNEGWIKWKENNTLLINYSLLS